MNMNLTMAMEGFYSLKVHGGKRGEIDFGTHKNMILDAGITHMLKKNDQLRYIHVGSGSSQPSAGQAQLDAKFAHTNRNKEITHGYVSADDSETGKAYGYSRLEVQFDKGAAKGNISEIGVGNNTQGNPLWSRSLILDKSGNPTSITILEDEYLTVTYEARRYVNTETVTTTLEYDDDGEKKQVKCKVIPSTRTTASGNGSGGVGGDMQFSSAFDSYYLENPKSNKVFSLTYDKMNSSSVYFKYSTSIANDVDISSVDIRNTLGGPTVIPNYTKLEFSPPLRKTNEFELTIGVTVTIERA